MVPSNRHMQLNTSDSEIMIQRVIRLVLMYNRYHYVECVVRMYSLEFVWYGLWFDV